jgi:hypothetical protein
MERQPASNIKVNFDAWSDGQVDSKLWLVDELMRLWQQHQEKPAHIWILGGWYAMSAFLLFTKYPSQVACVRSFDIDPEATRVADLVNKNWEIKDWKFKAITQDANLLDYNSEEYGAKPDLVINTSTEHFASGKWWQHIPNGTWVALQGTDMIHDEEDVDRISSCQELLEKFPLSQVLYQGKKNFRYPEWNFNRYMQIGLK